VVDEAAPPPIPLLETIFPLSLDVFITCFDELIEHRLAAARLVDSLPAVAWRRRGDSHGREVEARNMPMKREVSRVKRISSLGFVGSGCNEEEIDLSVNVG
jgi:hypothetical protein